MVFGNINHLLVSRIFHRCGWSLREWTIKDANKRHKHGNRLNIISVCGPSLIKLALIGGTIVDSDGFSLTNKCHNMPDITLLLCKVSTVEGLRFLLRKVKKLKRREVNDSNHKIKSFDQLRLLIEELILRQIYDLPHSIMENLSAKFRNVLKLDLHQVDHLDELNLEHLNEKCVTIKELLLSHVKVTNELLIEISKMLWLEKLYMSYCETLDDDKLELLLRGCPRLRAFSIIGNSSAQITDVGVKCIIDHCPLLMDLDISENDKVTDQSLQYLANYGHLRRLAVRNCRLISNEGVIDLVARWPLLEWLDIRCCSSLTTSILPPCLRSVLNRCSGQSLTLMVRGTGITKPNVSHPCLIVDFHC